MKLLKFGGSSVADAERIKQVSKIVQSYAEQGDVSVVVSALGGVTDLLIDTATKAKERDESYLDQITDISERHISVIEKLIAAKDLERVLEAFQHNLTALKDLLKGVYLLKELSARTLDHIMAFGELSSAFIISQHIPNAAFLDARTLIVSDSNFSYAKVDFEKTNENIRKHFKEKPKTYIITGFIASNDLKETTTLGRGGSDFTASIFGAALNVEAIEIWSDVDGVLTADPRKVRSAIPLESISYEEAMEMAHFGAKIIYPPTLQPAIDKDISIIIKNTFKPEFKGTIISEHPSESQKIVKGISSIDAVDLLKIEGSGLIGVTGVAGRLFSSLAREKINIIIITQASSEHSICLAVLPSQSTKAKQTIEAEFHLEIRSHEIDKVHVETDLSIIAIVGENMRKTPGVAGRFFEALGRNGINVVAAAQGSSELNLSVVINSDDLKKSLNVIHEAFFLSDTKKLNLFMIGVGLIGKTLISQVLDQENYLKKTHNISLNFVALANSKRYIFDEDGVDMSKWEEKLKASSNEMSFENFKNLMFEKNLRNSIFIDCTANEDIVAHYHEILPKSISIVTPNKIANSISFENYNQLKNLADKHNVKYLYETTVGAGLPVITTLNDLKNSGDRIIKIEAVLSGTLSYIFNNFTPEKSFSQIVKEANEKGFTEPDPRNDLNGKDVGRKILILARESGLKMEPDHIKIESLVSKNGEDAKSVEDFFKILEKEDDQNAERIKTAHANNNVLRYMAKLEDDKIEIGLQEVGSDHPFYNLSGSDNMIVFTTERYKDRPLVVKGPGAGAEVTAAGVFAEIISIAKFL
ncbi:MAG: bifunctional aspartate kinase/homoserine dehydrogenase I [Bacteroidia bacterium]|nr:bifunctional aspartate kinase/homoserine dehydrogenase I [Bacteroidia bacterium]